MLLPRGMSSSSSAMLSSLLSSPSLSEIVMSTLKTSAADGDTRSRLVHARVAALGKMSARTRGRRGYGVGVGGLE